jgi:uncharacterized protein (UPF0332 family)
VHPEKNIDLARVLAEVPRGAPEEASFRGACGRAYYAAFAVARDLLLSAGFRVDADGSAHVRVVEVLRESTHPLVRSAGGSLDALRRMRNSADYDVGLRATAAGVFDRLRAQLAVARARTIVDTIRKASASDPRLGIPSR